MKRQKRLWTAAAVCAVLGAMCRAVPGVRFAGLLFWCLTALLIVFAMLEQYKEHAWAKWGKRVLLALVCCGFAAFVYLESLVIRDAHTDARAEDAQCVIILGAGVNGTTPSLMLSSRLQAALDFIADKPDIPIICSGGQGPGEDISEADCMADWLIAHGVDESRIYREDRSTSTQENFAYSEEIMAELGRVYPDLGYNPYSGVTIDFEGLRASDKENFNAFMTELSAALHADGKTLYAAVMPAVYGDAYFDGYDFKTLGTLCDRVILMAHDYAASDLTGFLGSRYYRNHPCAPLYKVYYAVRTAAREMDDPAKLTLAVSMDARAWQMDADGLLTAVRSTHPLQTTVYKRLRQSGTVMGWSDTARSPWCTYTTESGQHIFLWYEDARSTAEKLACAKLVGVTSVSVWRLGLIPDYADEGLHYDVMSVL